MKKVISLIIVVLVFGALAISVGAKLSGCRAMSMGGSKASTQAQANGTFGFKLTLEKTPISLIVIPKESTLTLGGRKIEDPDSSKFYSAGKSLAVQYQSDVRVMLIDVGKTDEVQISILPLTSPKPKGDLLRLGKHEITRLPGNTDETYRFIFRHQTKVHIYEISQEVESTEIPIRFKSAVQSFQEVEGK